MKKSTSTRRPSPTPPLTRLGSTRSTESAAPRLSGKHPPQTLSSGAASGHLPRPTDMVSQRHAQPRFRTFHESRNTSPSKRPLNLGPRQPRLHFDSVSDCGSTSSSPSLTKTVRSDSAIRSGYYRSDGSSPGPKSIKSDNTSKSDTAAAVKSTIEGLNKAIGDDKRLVTITNACAEFDHWDEQKHNAELHYGAADVLTVYLSQTDDDDELRMICAALEMIFRASAKHVKIAFGKIGTSIVPLLLRVLEQCENNQVKHAEAIILNITKTLLIFSRVPDLRAFLARHHGMLDALKRVAPSHLNEDCRILRMRLFANLANCDTNKTIMLGHPGLLGSLLRVAALDTSDTAREYAGLSLMDLASEPANQVEMANVDKLLGTLVKLAILEKIPETRESAATTLQNLAFAKSNRVRLVTYGSGVVLEALKKTVGQDKDVKARRRAAGALTNLACNETGEIMGSHKGLLDTLAHVSTRDANVEVQQRAAMALTKIASSVSHGMPCHKNVLDALVIASESCHAMSAVVAVLRVKARDTSCRESMAFHPGVLDCLGDIGVDSKLPSKDRDNAMRAIMHLTNEPNNLRIMCCKKILSALVVGVSEGEDEIASSAITAMERLATEYFNRPYMARHEGLLTAVAMATEREAKLEDRAMATEREAKLEDRGEPKSLPLLAKPLLMSLLVAM